jgi:hypothetical protein
VDDSSYPNSRRRIAYFLDKLHIVPSTILALTFSKKATEELQARIGQLIPQARGGVTVKTYHAFCLGFITGNWAKLVSDCPNEFALDKHSPKMAKSGWPNDQEMRICEWSVRMLMKFSIGQICSSNHREKTDAGTAGEVHLSLAPSPILHHQSIHRTAHLRALSSFCAILNVAFFLLFPAGLQGPSHHLGL